MSAIIVDFRPIVISFARCESMYPVFKSLSLKTIISILLSVTKDEKEDIVTIAIDESFKRFRVPVLIDIDDLEIFYMNLLEELEDEIYSKFNHVDINIIFDSWADETTAILRVD